MSEPLEGANRSQGTESDAGFDSYQSLAYPDIRNLVAKDVVPSFRFKAGGWELVHSSVRRWRPASPEEATSYFV